MISHKKVLIICRFNVLEQEKAIHSKANYKCHKTKRIIQVLNNRMIVKCNSNRSKISKLVEQEWVYLIAHKEEFVSTSILPRNNLPTIKKHLDHFLQNKMVLRQIKGSISRFIWQIQHSLHGFRIPIQKLRTATW